MQQHSASDPLLERIGAAIRLYHRPPSQGITAVELIDGIFLILGESERYDLVNEVAQLIPEPVQGELRRRVEAILRPGATYVPFTIGRPAGPEAWRQRMMPACRRLAGLFRQHLDTVQRGPGPTGA
jgi:hypothetical protein